MKHTAGSRFLGLMLILLWGVVTASLVGCSARRGPEKSTLPPVSKKPITIESIDFSEEQDYTRVTIEGSRDLAYESLELLEDPLRISVGIPDASLEVDTPISVNNGTVTEIMGVADGDRRRIEIGLVKRVGYNITQEANRVYVDIERTQTAKPITPAEPALVREIEDVTKMAPATALTAVSAHRHDDMTEVIVTADGVIHDYNAFPLTSPPRLVIDLWRLKKKIPKNIVDVQTSHVKRIRIGRHPKKTRLVLDASVPKLPRYRIDRFRNELVVVMGDLEGFDEGSPGVLAGVDFKQIDNRSRVVLSSSVKVDYDVFKVSEHDVVIHLKKMRAPKHLKRDIDTHAFDSAVESIRLYNVRSEMSRDVRVIIHLREVADFETFQEGERIFVDFQRPLRARVEKANDANPGTVSQSSPVTENAATEEKSQTEGGQEQTLAAADQSAASDKEISTGDVSGPEEKVEAATPVETEGAEKKTSTAEPASSGPEPETAAEVVVDEKPAYEFALMPGKRYTGRRLSLDFKDADIKNILRLIAEVSNLNVVAGDDVKGKVTIRLIDVPWDQALDIILFSNNLGKMRMGNVIRVAPVETLKKEEEAVLSAKRNKEKLEDLVTELIPVNYSTAQELQTQIKNILSDRGSISIDTRTNTLVVKDIPTNIVEARRLVETLDMKTPQVVIEARIVEASTNFSRELGVRWGGTLPPAQISGTTTTLGIKGGIGTDTAASFPVTGATSGITFNLANMGDITNLDVELTALESAGEGQIISAPRITTLDNKEASIEQGLRIPYLKLTAEGTATTEFIEANIKLSVIPHVTADGHIKMNIKASKDTPDSSITVQGVPAIDKKEAITEVLVQDGDVVVIAGIYSIEKTDNVDRVPVLGKVPILGYFFRRTEKSDDRRDLLIFISPRIVQDMV